MKKIFSLICLVISLNFLVFSQANNTVDLNNDVYEFLSYGELNGLCKKLSNAKPYTQSYIIKKLEEMIITLENQESEDIDNDYEIQLIQNYIESFKVSEGKDLKNARLMFSNNNENVPLSFILQNSFEGSFSSGLYDEKIATSYGYELWDVINFSGDLGKNFSYKNKTYVGVTYMPLQEMGTYDIGRWWFNDTDTQDPRYIKTYKNNSYLPYSYRKVWDGSCYYLGELSANGLEGWPNYLAIGFSMQGEIHGSFFDDKVELGVGRNAREFAAMDNGSSLVLNGSARPFFGLDTKFSLFDFLSISSVTGVLEFPNQDYINDEALYRIDENGNKISYENGEVSDSFFFQNAFSLTMVDLDLKYLHFDFGSAAIWPKRFELGYAFPLIDRVVYQNDVGDYDNLSLFADLKFRYPGLGSIWLSGYLDEVNVLKSKFWEQTRAMFAVQVGTKVILPFIPYTTVSFRYTKVEPYCYTHHSFNKNPYYDHYICESYTNNGESLGYYLPPNSDEFHFKIETKAVENANINFQYQLIRHGVDWGTMNDGAVPGSNLYSELRTQHRSDLRKCFLKDGVYEWSNIISVYCSYDFKKQKIPLTLYTNIGYIYDWFTASTFNFAQNSGKTRDENYEDMKQASFHYINNDKYNDKSGVVITVGFKMFY